MFVRNKKLRKIEDAIQGLESKMGGLDSRIDDFNRMVKALETIMRNPDGKITEGITTEEGYYFMHTCYTYTYVDKHMQEKSVGFRTTSTTPLPISSFRIKRSGSFVFIYNVLTQEKYVIDSSNPSPEAISIKKGSEWYDKVDFANE